MTTIARSYFAKFSWCSMFVSPGHEDIARCRQRRQEGAVLHPLEPQVLDVPDVQPWAAEQRRELARDVLVDDDSHAPYPVTSRSCSTSSSAATACARVTEG